MCAGQYATIKTQHSIVYDPATLDCIGIFCTIQSVILLLCPHDRLQNRGGIFLLIHI
jgi:hypothetical protein